MLFTNHGERAPVVKRPEHLFTIQTEALPAIGLQIFHVWALVLALQASLDGNALALLGQLAGALLFLTDEKRTMVYRTAGNSLAPCRSAPSVPWCRASSRLMIP